MKGPVVTEKEALKLVLLVADEWAGEYGFVMPDQAKKVYEAIAILERAGSE
jgi:hypothetical protein